MSATPMVAVITITTVLPYTGTKSTEYKYARSFEWIWPL